MRAIDADVVKAELNRRGAAKDIQAIIDSIPTLNVIPIGHNNPLTPEEIISLELPCPIWSENKTGSVDLQILVGVDVQKRVLLFKGRQNIRIETYFAKFRPWLSRPYR